MAQRKLENCARCQLLRDLRRILPELRRGRPDFNLLGERAHLHGDIRTNNGSAGQDHVCLDSPLEARRLGGYAVGAQQEVRDGVNAFHGCARL